VSRRVVLAAVVGAVIVLVAVTLFRAAPASGPSGTTGGQPGQLAPLFQSTDVNGRPVALADDRGHRVLLNFWASWCIPCRTEFPVLKRLLAAHPDVIVLGVVFDDSDSAAAAFIRSQGATWPGVRDPRAQIAGAYDVHAKPGIPVSILIDPSGRVRGRQAGPLTDDQAAADFIAQAPAS